MVALTVCYKTDVKLDADYYFAKHLPLVAEKLVPHGVRKSEVRKIVATPTGEPAPYQFIATLYFDDIAALQSCLQSPDGQAVGADIPNFYGGAPDLVIAEVVG